MSSIKKLATIIFSAALVFNFLFVPASSVDAYTTGFASLNVRADRLFVSAATDYTGYVAVGLQIEFVDTNTGSVYANGTQNTVYDGHAYCDLSTGWYTNIITYAKSYHWVSTGNITMALTWDPLNGYSAIY